MTLFTVASGSDCCHVSARSPRPPSRTLPHAHTHTHTHTSTSMPSYCVLPALCFQIPSQSLLCLLLCCKLCFCVLGCVYSCARIPMCVCVCMYDNLGFHRVSSLPSETQPQEEDHSSFTPSYCHFTQWVMHCSQTHTHTDWYLLWAHTHTHTAMLGCGVCVWVFVLCTAAFGMNVWAPQWPAPNKQTGKLQQRTKHVHTSWLGVIL